jgi:hypothetical protein
MILAISCQTGHGSGGGGEVRSKGEEREEEGKGRYFGNFVSQVGARGEVE